MILLYYEDDDDAKRHAFDPLKKLEFFKFKFLS